jgi:hypothetical protein
VRQLELRNEPLHRRGALHGVQVFALQILDESPFSRHLIIDLVDHNRRLGTLEQRERPEAPFTSNQLESLPFGTDNQGLHEASRLN